METIKTNVPADASISSIFYNAVSSHLIAALAEARTHDKEGEQTNGVYCEFYLDGLLRECGATNVSFSLNQSKGYSFYRAKFTDGAFIDVREFGPRRQMTQAEYDTLGTLKPKDIIAVAGLWVDGEKVTTSFRWDRLVLENGKEKTFGPVRKWNGSSFDEPIYAEKAEEKPAEKPADAKAEETK